MLSFSARPPAKSCIPIFTEKPVAMVMVMQMRWNYTVSHLFPSETHPESFVKIACLVVEISSESIFRPVSYLKSLLIILLLIHNDVNNNLNIQFLSPQHQTPASRLQGMRAYLSWTSWGTFRAGHALVHPHARCWQVTPPLAVRSCATVGGTSGAWGVGWAWQTQRPAATPAGWRVSFAPPSSHPPPTTGAVHMMGWHTVAWHTIGWHWGVTLNGVSLDGNLHLVGSHIVKCFILGCHTLYGVSHWRHTARD